MKITKINNFLPFGAPDIGKDEINEVIKCLKSGWLGSGPKVKEFEKLFCEYKDVRNSLAVNSCTAAIFLALKCLEIGPGDEVITTSMTFCSTVNSIIHTGAKPVLVDIIENTSNIDPIKIKDKITSKTKAIIPVHFSGLMCEMDEIMSLAKRHNLYVIEDCAHAIESTYKNKKAGTFGDFGCFSFYATKNLVTGEGGMLISNNDKYIDKCRKLALHGMSLDAWKRYGAAGYKHYSIDDAGYKFNMMDLQASIGLHQLNKIDKNWIKRKKIWDRYQQELKDLPIKLPYNNFKEKKHAYHLFTIQIDRKKAGISRDEFLERMKEYNIGCGVHYRSIPDHEFYKNEFGFNASDYPIAKVNGDRTVSLPLSPKLTISNINYIVDVIKSLFR